jgi:hypothetical protein
MAMSFHAALISSEQGLYLYRIQTETEVAHVILDTNSQQIAPATPEGEPVGVLRMLLQSGNLTLPVSDDNSQDERDERDEQVISRGDFAQVSAHIGRQWMKTGQPPAEVTKYFG